MEAKATKYRAYRTPWAEMPKDLLREAGLTAREKLLIAQLLDWGSFHGGTVCRASNRAIADAIGVHPDSIPRLVRSIRAKHAAGQTGWNVAREYTFGARNKFKVIVPPDDWSPGYMRIAAEPEQGRRAEPPRQRTDQLPLFETKPALAKFASVPGKNAGTVSANPRIARNPNAGWQTVCRDALPAQSIKLQTAAAAALPSLAEMNYATLQRSPRPPDPAAGTIFAKPRFNFMEFAAGKDPGAAIIEAHTRGLFSWARVHRQQRLVLSVKASGPFVFLHLCTGNPGQSQPLRCPISSLASLELS